MKIDLRLNENQIQLLVILTRAYAEYQEFKKLINKEFPDLNGQDEVEANTLYAIMQTKANNLGIPTV